VRQHFEDGIAEIVRDFPLISMIVGVIMLLGIPTDTPQNPAKKINPPDPKPDPDPSPHKKPIHPTPTPPCTISSSMMVSVAYARSNTECHSFIYRAVLLSDLGKNPATAFIKAAALRDPIDYLTGLSFVDDVARYSGDPNRDTGQYLKYNVDKLREAGYIVVSDGGNVVGQLPEVDLSDIAGYYDANQENRIKQALGTPFPTGHYTVYMPLASDWTRWFKDEYQAKNQKKGGFSIQTLAFYNLREIE
jgi:hypothetical protein